MKTRPTGALILVLAILAALSGCRSTPPPAAPEPVEKSVLSIQGVRHGPLLILPDRVEAGALLRGQVESQTKGVLIQAMLEADQRPLATRPLEGLPERSLPFSIPIPADATGTVIVRAIDQNKLYTDKEISVDPIAPGS